MNSYEELFRWYESWIRELRESGDLDLFNLAAEIEAEIYEEAPR